MFIFHFVASSDPEQLPGDGGYRGVPFNWKKSAELEPEPGSGWQGFEGTGMEQSILTST